MRSESKHYCRVCGYYNQDLPWGDDDKTPSFEFCDCCGVEFGYGDATQKAVRNYREKWLRSGAKWFNEKAKPEHWAVEEQLKNVPDDFED